MGGIVQGCKELGWLGVLVWIGSVLVWAFTYLRAKVLDLFFFTMVQGP